MILKICYAPTNREPQQNYAGVIVSLARQKHPDTSAYQDPEIVTRLEKRHHIGFIMASEVPDRINFLLEEYTQRFANGFLAALPPSESRPPSSDTQVRHSSTEFGSFSSTEMSGPVMLSAAKHLASNRDRPFAEFTLSAANGLRLTLCDCSNYQGLFFTIEPCLSTCMITSNNRCKQINPRTRPFLI